MNNKLFIENGKLCNQYLEKGKHEYTSFSNGCWSCDNMLECSKVLEYLKQTRAAEHGLTVSGY